MKHKSKLNRTLRTLLLQGAKSAGSYDPAEVLPHIEESLTQTENKTALDFLTWVRGGGQTFGHGNIDQVYSQFTKSV